MDETRQPLLASFEDGSAESESQGPFVVSPDSLQDLFDPKNLGLLGNLGGAHGICSALNVDPDQGLEDDPFDAGDRIRVFGKNSLPPAELLSLLELMWLAAHDR